MHEVLIEALRVLKVTQRVGAAPPHALERVVQKVLNGEEVNE